MNDSRPIAVFDSGVGGLPYLQRLREFLPDEYFHYIADTAHFPYGEKTTAQLTEIVHRQMGLVIGRLDPKLAVVACNTASVVALSGLREAYGIPFIGVVPAIKPAAERTRNGRIGVLATRKTVEDQYTRRLEKRFAAGFRVCSFAGGGIVDLVEHRYFTATRLEIEEAVRPAVSYFSSCGADHVVLACTHFIFLEQVMGRLLGPGVHLVDSRDGVARQTRRVLEAEGLRTSVPAAGALEGLAGPLRGTEGSLGTAAADSVTLTDKTGESFYVTSPSQPHAYRRFAEMYGLAWRGVL